jgi:uncharacterized membrane protein
VSDALAAGRGVPAAGDSLRRGYLDWVRGLAVLIMIGSHLLDSWTADFARDTRAYRWAMLAAGMGAPLFLFLAGIAVPLSAGSKTRRFRNAAFAARLVARRGLQLYGLAFLFRGQAWILGLAPPWTLLKVDILNIMGPAIVAAAALWRSTGTVRARAVVFGSAAMAAGLATPFVRAAPLAALPDPVEAYLRPVPELTHFAFFPFVGFLFAGGVLGVLIDAGIRESRLNAAFAGSGLVLAIGALAASHWPPLHPESAFWTTSLSFFLIRVGVLTVTVAVAYGWASRPGGERRRWSPLEQFGRTSLFVYWIHVEMIYGLISRPVHRSLTLPQAALAFILLTAVLLGCSVVKERLGQRWRARLAPNC